MLIRDLCSWEEAEEEASRGLELIPPGEVDSPAWKLYYRRGAARRELGRIREAEEGKDWQ